MFTRIMGPTPEKTDYSRIEPHFWCGTVRFLHVNSVFVYPVRVATSFYMNTRCSEKPWILSPRVLISMDKVGGSGLLALSLHPHNGDATPVRPEISTIRTANAPARRR